MATAKSDEALVAYLLGQWQEGLRLTTIAQAMAALGMSPDDEKRWRIGQRLQAVWKQLLRPEEFHRRAETLAGQRRRPVDQAQLSAVIEEAQRWNPAVYILTEDEKMVARYILLASERGMHIPSKSEVAQALNINEVQVDAALRILRRLEFLTAKRDGSYQLRPGYQRFLAGLSFNFHTVTLESGERFNVPCAFDFMLLVSNTYTDQKITIDDSCAHCVDRIRLVFDHGDLIEVRPSEVYAFRGGT